MESSILKVIYTYCKYWALKYYGTLKEGWGRQSVTCSRIARSQKIKRPNLAISSFKKGQILYCWKRPNKGQIFKGNLPKYIKNVWNIINCCMFCWNLAKIGLKRYYFFKIEKKTNWLNHFISRKLFQKGQMATLTWSIFLVFQTLFCWCFKHFLKVIFVREIERHTFFIMQWSVLWKNCHMGEGRTSAKKVSHIIWIADRMFFYSHTQK
jgi:hypothetical protein